MIETDRLILRKFTRDDVSDVFEFSSNLEVVKWTGDKTISRKEEALDIIENIWLHEYDEIGYARYAVYHKKDKKVIGFSGLKYEPEWDATDIGYRLLPQYWGKGLATESVLPFISLGFNNFSLSKIIGAAYQINKASCRILEKIGMQLEKEGILIDDNPNLCNMYSITKVEYNQRLPKST